jgi:recombination protein RecA
LINQVRESVGVHFGNPEKPVGGRAVGFFASQRVEFRKGEAIKGKKSVVEDGKLSEKDATIGRVVRVRIEKDKTSPNAEKTGSFRYIFSTRAVDRPWELLQLGLETGIVQQSGMRYHCKWVEDLQRAAFLTRLTNPKTARMVEAAIRMAASGE